MCDTPYMPIQSSGTAECFSDSLCSPLVLHPLRTQHPPGLLPHVLEMAAPQANQVYETIRG